MKQTINLMAKEQGSYLTPKNMMKVLSFFLAMLVAATIIMLIWIGVTQWRLSGLKEQTQTLLTQQNQAKESENTALTVQRDMIKATLLVATETQAFMNDRTNPKYSFILIGLGKSKVEGVWITKVGVEKEAQDMIIEGKAKTVESMLTMLKNLRQQVAFKKAQLQILKLGKNAQGHYDFTMLGHYARAKQNH